MKKNYEQFWGILHNTPNLVLSRELFTYFQPLLSWFIHSSIYVQIRGRSFHCSFHKKSITFALNNTCVVRAPMQGLLLIWGNLVLLWRVWNLAIYQEWDNIVLFCFTWGDKLNRLASISSKYHFILLYWQCCGMFFFYAEYM